MTSGLMCQAVFFDAGDTLFHTQARREERVARALTRRGRAADVQVIRETLWRIETGMQDSPLWRLSSRAAEDRWWLTYYREVLADLGEDPGLAGEVAGEVLYTRHVEAFPETHAVLDSLRGQVRLGVISNAFPSLDEALDLLGLTSYFDAVVNSSLVDAWKPDARIYQIALEELGVSAGESVFVDDLPDNVAAAEELGFTALLVDRRGRHLGSQQRRITDLWPVARLIEGQTHR